MTRLALLPCVCCLSALPGCDGRPTAALPSHRPGPVVAIPVAIEARPAPTYEADVAPTIEHYCLPCHDRSTNRGGIALDGLSSDRPGVEAWGRVAAALRAGTMPPAGRAKPSSAELGAIDGWLDAEVFRCSAPDADPGRVTMRRLTRAEYDHTIRDLIGLDLHLADDFPADDVGHGFDRIGDVLSTPPILMEKYLEAADRAIEASGRSPSSWSRIMNPSPDAIPPDLRRPTFAARSEPVKRIGRPPAAPPRVAVEAPEQLALRRAGDVLRAFADRAYRRPATADELARLVALVESARKDGDAPEEAIRYALKAVLVSPHFLYLVEEDSEAGSPGADGLVGEFELAARLSYFLWSSLPDDELSRLAARGELRRGDALAKQARRMLGDERSRALVDGFASQWLQIGPLKDATPDPARFPEFDEPLRRAMIEETARFAGAIFREDRPVFEFLDADSTFVNERLARHYGITGVVGDRFRRVSLAGTRRGGVLTQASILTVTSNATRTSPVRRGRWILENLLGMPPDPPPEGVEGLKPEGGNAAGRSSTLREAMERHRAEPGCASCHARMDPLGFGLEDFDAVGARRADEGGRPVDSSGLLPGGESFRGPEGLRAVLLARREAFARCLAEKLLTYALGRGVGAADRCFVEEIVRKLDRGGGRSSALVVAIVESPPFRRRSIARTQR